MIKKSALIKGICDDTKLSEAKAKAVLNEVFVSRAIPSVLRDKVYSNIAEGAKVDVEQAGAAMAGIVGRLTEDAALYELAVKQVVAAWINDCDGCNNCASMLEKINPAIESQVSTK